MGRCQWGGRINGTKGGRGGSDGNVIGCRGGGEEGQDGGWGMGCAGMQNEEISKETVGEYGDYLPYTWS